MQPEPLPTFVPHLSQRFQSLVWSCLDSDLVKSAVFHAERYYAIDTRNHDARHLYATALLRAQQTYSALHLVSGPRDEQCTGCLEIKAKCCTTLGRYRQAREALDATLRDINYVSSSIRIHICGRRWRVSVLSVRLAFTSRRVTLSSFIVLDTAGRIPDIDQLFPPKPVPVKRGPVQIDDTTTRNVPMATGAGFFTPDASGPVGRGGNLFGGWRPDAVQPQPFRLGAVEFPRDSIDTSFLPDNSFQMRRTTRSQPSNVKKLRSTAGRQIDPKPKSSSKTAVDEPLKKARARPALSFANIFSSSHSQPAAPSRAPTTLTKNNAQPNVTHTATRRSNRLQSGSGAKQLHLSKHPPATRRRQATHGQANPSGEVAESTSTPSALSPGSEASPPPPPTWTLQQEQQAQEEYEHELAEHYLYDLLAQLEQLPVAHQRSTSVLIMVGKVHYELQDYASAERAFRSAREIEPYRLWDMEVYSTLLWHLQRNIELSYLAQELLNINPQSSQAWIAIGNLFSLQKDRSQALTCFKRASQLDPSCAYAFTLSGHETIDENLDRSINFFESALRVDARHYNAWYGLGTCYLRASKIRRAEYHFRKAMEIHPNNAVVLGCVAMRRKELNSALSYYNKAIEVSPENALVRYRRAKMMVSMRKYDEAIEDLEYLRRTTPEEANVIFQLAKVYRLIGDEVKSAQALAVARDIAPKSLNKMKRLLETVRDDGDDQMDEG
ncbi:hypothetical protein DFP72DRAFT_869216 [Ephemerocybe angulata]|uniref:TPR-like protein n=1 Tax=Ephemerocybe angulata TaxID=980116 RepID=A0A8H6IFV4_9AGAR|nr:hypothetical protein DFP72DRAFT_869216 [Tulosesus angulatus]